MISKTACSKAFLLGIAKFCVYFANRHDFKYTCMKYDAKIKAKRGSVLIR